MKAFTVSEISVSIQQPSIATYRKSFYEKLNHKVKLKLFYGRDGVPSELTANIENKFSKIRLFKIGNRYLKWHQAQLTAITAQTDLAILSWDIQYISLWIAIINAKIIRKPFILWGHGYSKQESKFRRIFRNIPIYFSAAVILYDYNTAENLRKVKSFTKKIFVAPNSLNYESIAQTILSYKKSQKILDDFKLKKELNETFNIVYIGRIYKENKLELLLNAIAHVASRYKIKLIIIGKENDYVAQLKLLAEELLISDNLIWVGEVYQETEIAPWMLLAHLSCYPANIGLSLMHSFCYGLPVITDDNIKSHNPEIFALENNVNGLLYTKDSVDDFVIKIEELISNNDKRVKMAKHALETVKLKFNTSKMVDGFVEAINFVMNDENPS